jgi:TadE-like protein
VKTSNHRHNERGATIAELAVVALVFFMIIFGIIEFGRLLYTHNALTDATRRGARYAVLHKGLTEADENAVKNYVVYGDDTPTLDALGNPTDAPLINGLTTAMVVVDFEGVDKDGDPETPEKTNFGSNLGTATVKIENYQFNLSIPVIGRVLTLPAYETTLTAESAGEVPEVIAVGP